MADRERPIRNEPAWFRVDGNRRGRGVVLLYADLRTDRSGGLAGLFVTETLVVTTADGTEYGFAGRTAYLQADVASALASQGRDVRATPLGLEVRPRAIGNGV
jgi:hypothetical protein